MASQQAALEAYTTFYEQMERESLLRLDEFFTQRAHFKDPFNDVYGVERIRTIFHHMFDTLENPKFVVDEATMNEGIAYIKWQFTAKLKKKSLKLVGMPVNNFI